MILEPTDTWEVTTERPSNPNSILSTGFIDR